MTFLHAVAQLHGLDAGFTLALGTQTTFDALDVSRFTRLQKLQLRHYSPGRARELGWWLGLPASLRVLHLDGLNSPLFMVNPNCTPNLTESTAGPHERRHMSRGMPQPDCCSCCRRMGCHPTISSIYAVVEWARQTPRHQR